MLAGPDSSSPTLCPIVASVMEPAEIDALHERLSGLPEPARRARFAREDWRGALGVFLLVFLTTFPVVIPFLVFREMPFKPCGSPNFIASRCSLWVGFAFERQRSSSSGSE